MGMFDDLIPKSEDPEAMGGVGMANAAIPKSGLFDDLIPVKSIDWTRPAEEIRRQIAEAPEDKRKALHDAWADYRIAQSKLPQLPDAGRGIPILGNLADEMTGAAQAGLHAITGGKLGMPYDEATAEERARQRAIHKKHPILAPMTELAGGIVTGGPIFSKLSRATTLPGQIAEGMAIGAPLASVEGALTEGNAQERLDAARERFVPGAVMGAAAPLVLRGGAQAVAKGADLLSPQIARVEGNLKGLRDRLAIKMSADGAPPNFDYGADEAANQIIANQLARANIPMSELRRRFQEADDATRFASTSRAQQALAPVDIDPSLQRLAGSVARQQPEADNIGKAFQYSRQTGQPSGLSLPNDVNIPTRPALSKPGADDPPMGQMERVFDALKRALNIHDEAAHGHAKSGYATEKLVMSRAREEGGGLYRKAEAAAEGYDVRPHIQPVLDRLKQQAAEEPRSVGAAMNAMLRQFETKASGTVDTLAKFQKAKEFSDGIIQNWLKGPSRNRYVGGRLAEMQRELLAAVDDIKPNAIGETYQAARNTFAGEMQLKDALKLGRELAREDSEVAIDQLRELATDGERKMALLGFYEKLRLDASRKGRTDDVTKIFTTPRMQEILREIIPRPKGRDAVFANRPERFGEYIASEQRMIQTRNQTMGNSKTPERLADDEALNNMQSMIEAAKQSTSNPSLSGVILRTMETVLSKMFGFRADTAAAVARKLYTANPMERERLLQAVERRMGPGRAAHFARIVTELSRGSAGPVVSGYASSGMD